MDCTKKVGRKLVGRKLGACPFVGVSVCTLCIQSTIDSEGFKGGTRGAPIMPRDAVSRTANVEGTSRH